jgi:DNA ligase D-like protein (predicted polymerase)
MKPMSGPAALEVAGRRVSITHPDKVVFPAHAGSGPYTKLDLLRYYLAVADGALRGVAGRPMILKRFVKGISEEAVFQKRAPAKRPDWVDVAELRYASGTFAAEAVIHDAAGLAWAINLGCVDLNPHPVLAGDLDHPDELRVDLDPMPGVTWRRIVDVALVAREVLEDYGLVAWPKTSGSRGFHIYARIAPRWRFPQVRLAAQTVAREVERRIPDAATSRWWKEEREGVFVDFNQNAKDRTVASAYSVRATPDARVSTPLHWDEVADCAPEAFTMATVPDRFADIGDPWAGSTGYCCSPKNWVRPRRRRRGPERGASMPVEGASRRSRSSKSPAPRPRTRRWPRWTPGVTATPPPPPCFSHPTCWSTACAVPVRSGTASGSTCSASRKNSARRRRS